MSDPQSNFPEISSDRFRRGMRQWASGVTVVTSKNQDTRHGMTVSSFTSISVEPHIIMVALGKDTRTHRLVSKSKQFAATILTSHQQDISNRFAGQDTEGQNRFAGIDTFDLYTGCPLIAHGLAYFDCVVIDSHLIGTNTVFYGEVVATQVDEDLASKKPLVYFNQGYRQLDLSA